MIAAEKVRVIDANIMVTCADGTVFTGSYRLVTTLTDAGRYPAAVLVGLYHQRWEHESAYYALRHTLMNGRVLRSGDRAGVEQEMWALLTLYQALRTTMVEAAESLPGTDPDRCCFTIALPDRPRPGRPGRRRHHRPCRCRSRRTDRAPDPGPSPAAPTAARQHPQGQVTDVPLQHPP